MEICIGVKVRDRITGFEGIVTGHVRYLTGCDQFLVQPPVKEGNDFVEARWFDVNRLDVIEADVVRIDTVKAAGPDVPAPIR